MDDILGGRPSFVFAFGWWNRLAYWFDGCIVHQVSTMEEDPSTLRPYLHSYVTKNEKCVHKMLTYILFVDLDDGNDIVRSK